MTDITGNFGVNSHSNYGNENVSGKKGTPAETSSSSVRRETEHETDLGKQPGAITGQTIVKHSSAIKDKSGEYTFDAGNVEDDVYTFQLLADFTKECREQLIAAGMEESAAQEKALAYAECLLSSQNS